MEEHQVKRVKEEHNKGLEACLEKIKQWEKFKSDYEALNERLETLPNRLSYDITVPLGPNAFTLGKLVHTNEITVLLGDNWFADVSAKQASGIAQRRIKQCTDMLEGLTKEKQQYENWLSFINEVSESQENFVEIKEEYDEEKEKLWKEQHAKNVREHHQKLAEEKKAEEAKPIEKLLNDLELKENNSDKSGHEFSDDSSQYSEESNHRKSSTSSVLNGETHSESDIIVENEENKTQNADDDDHQNGIKHVRWQDLSRHSKITFKHTKSKNRPCPGSKSQGYNKCEDQPLIRSPSDIYKHFGNYFQSSPPKSILKIKSSPSPTTELQPFFQPDDNSKKYIPDKVNETQLSAFTGEVYEHSESKPIPNGTKSTRPSSHFKCSRKNRRK